MTARARRARVPQAAAPEIQGARTDLADAFPVPMNEPARLAALRELKILDTPSDERFDRLVRLAIEHFKMPVARITFVDEDRTWFKSCVGLTVQEAPRRISICSYAVMDDEVLISTDLANDPRFADSRQVTGKPYFRFYAGAPIILPGGLRVGSICLMDYEPHPDFSDADAAFLKDLSNITVHELELHRELAERDQSLTTAAEDLALAQQAKKRFMAMVNHELRTPLNAILGFGELISEERMGPVGVASYIEYAQYICDSSRRLDGLINRVLIYSSAEKGDLTLAESEIDVPALARKCTGSAQTEASIRSITVALDISPTAPTTIFADSVQLMEIIMQLLLNAIAFSDPGGTVCMSIRDHDGGGLRLRVTDHGPGIRDDQLAHVMGAFSQGDEALSRTHEGIGLGLPITKVLAELHGGRMTIVSRPGEGTTIEVNFPASRNR